MCALKCLAFLRAIIDSFDDFVVQIGYNVSIYYAPVSTTIEKRLTFTDPQALCTPVHANVGVATKLSFSKKAWAVLGDLGNRLIRGLYTTNALIDDGHDPTLYAEMFDADFWRDYVRNELLIEALKESDLRDNRKYYPPNATYCADGVYGCLDNCSKNYACTLRELSGKECMMVVGMQSSSTRAYYPALMENLGFPAYICHIGRNGLQEYVLERLSQRKAVLWYMDYPDEFVMRYPHHFQRVSMPKGTAEDIAKFTSLFGENGYGNKTGDPVTVDRFEDTLDKVVSYNIMTESDNLPVYNVFSRIRLPDANFEDVLGRYVDLTNDSTIESEDPFFDAACGWMRDNYAMWTDWMLNPLPLCTVEDHMVYSVSGCDSSTRQITFQWAHPDPTNSSKPYVCDGGVMELPATLSTSRTCKWINESYSTWLDWITRPPKCDATFFSYVVNDCGTDAKREIEFYWFLPAANNASASAECTGSLPDTVSVDCEYMPDISSLYVAIVVLTAILASSILVSMFLVFHYRTMPIIRRSQFEFLETMLVGALLVCAAIILYAGKPTDGLCGVRPAIISIGFTLVFGSLVVKTLRVYRIFNSKKLKRVVLPTQTMFKVLACFLLVDAVVIISWFVVDFPAVTHVADDIEEVATGAIVDRAVCLSSSFIFSALLIFWKAILLGTGLYLSFLVRKVSVDFQESVWIFSSSVVVAIACLLVLPLAYLVPLAAATFYAFFAGVLWIAVFSVVALMLVPKILRHKEDASTNSGSSVNSDDTSTHGNKTETGPILPEKPAKRISDGRPGPPDKHLSALHHASRVTPAGDKGPNLQKPHGIVPSGVL